ncbi:MAG: YbaK/EbsC family protein [Bacteroidetes bacterium]|nr:YbaK/EbsC family protein [Bacteroidota bacterium]
MPAKKLKTYLDENNIQYVTITHSQAFTAQKIAASAHIPGKKMAKTVIVKVDGRMVMAVLPGSYRIDMKTLQDVTGSKNVSLASEEEFQSMFPGCETGAMPPFGNLYDMEVYVAASLSDDEEIAFNAGTHTELIQMAFEDFKKLVRPHILIFSYH